MTPPPPSPSSPEKAITYSTFLLRLVAYMADSLILAALLVAALFLMGVDQKSETATAVNVVLTSVFFIYCHKRWGATPGKMAVALQVVSIDGKPLTYLQSFLRYSPYLVTGCIALYLPGIETAFDGDASAPPVLAMELRVFLSLSFCWYAASVAYMLNRPDRRTLHDILAYTVVIRHGDRHS